jgi:hypothetical protein
MVAGVIFSEMTPLDFTTNTNRCGNFPGPTPAASSLNRCNIGCNKRLDVPIAEVRRNRLREELMFSSFKFAAVNNADSLILARN